MSRNTKREETDNNKKKVALPHVEGTTERIKNNSVSNNIKIIFTTDRRIIQIPNLKIYETVNKTNILQTSSRISARGE